jgi:protein TonB
VLKSELRTYFGVVDVDVVEDSPKAEPDKAETPPPPEPEPETQPATEPSRADAPKEEPAPTEEKAPAEKSDDPYADEPPPAAAQAADVLNSGDEQPGEDLSSWTMVHKEGSKVTGGGYTSGDGTAQNAVKDPRASSKGKEGGRGSGTGEVKSTSGSPAVNRSRPAMPLSRNLSDCPFPPQADMAQVDRAVVDVTVTVDPSGRPTGASVAGDPGYGFGSQAKRCALAMRYEPALNPAGDPIAGTTPTLRFRFNR